MESVSNNNSVNRMCRFCDFNKIGSSIKETVLQYLPAAQEGTSATKWQRASKILAVVGIALVLAALIQRYSAYKNNVELTQTLKADYQRLWNQGAAHVVDWEGYLQEIDTIYSQGKMTSYILGGLGTASAIGAIKCFSQSYKKTSV